MRRGKGNSEIPDPVAGCGESHALGTVPGWKDLGLDSPDHWTPGCCKAQNEERCKDNQDNTRSFGQLWVLEIESEMTDGSEDHKADFCHVSIVNEAWRSVVLVH